MKKLSNALKKNWYAKRTTTTSGRSCCLHNTKQRVTIRLSIKNERYNAMFTKQQLIDMNTIPRGRTIEQKRVIRDMLLEALSPLERKVYHLACEDMITSSWVQNQLDISRSHAAQLLFNLYEWGVLDRHAHKNKYSGDRWFYVYYPAPLQLELREEPEELPRNLELPF